MFDVNKIREDFPMLENHPQWVYFDNAATTFKPRSVIQAVMDYYERHTCNIHRGDYDLSFTMSEEYEKTRQVVADFIGADSAKEIVFTAGATSALNAVAYGYEKSLNENDVILTTQAEHASSILPWFRVCEHTKACIEYIPLNECGEITIDNFKKALTDQVKVVVIASVSNVLGHAVSMIELCRLAHEVGAIVVCDGAQTVSHMPVNVSAWDVDFFAFSAHKMCAPSGIGVLYGKKALLDKLDVLFYGGGSNARFDREGCIVLKETPYKFESGTPAIEGVLGLKAAIHYLDAIGMDVIQQCEVKLKEYCIQQMKQLDHVILYNATALSGIVTFNIEGIFSQDVASYLNSKKIAVRSGHHCAKILPTVLKTTDTVRASFYFYNTKEEIDRFIQAVSEITLENCINLIL